MNRREAYNILGLSENASKEEINAAFRKLAKEHHPDRNPNNPDAESKFKEINSAYQLLQKEPEPGEPFDFPWGNPFQTIFTSFHKNKRSVAKQPPIVDIKISFKESILGCNQEVEYDRFEKCDNCNGNGVEVQAGLCKTCNGKGFKHANFSRGNVKFMSACSDCDGSGYETHDCGKCNGKMGEYKKTKLKINLPGGLHDQQVVRVAGGGHFVSTSDFFNSPGYGDLFLKITVEPDPDMVIEDTNVVSSLPLTLLEALTGTIKKVRTVKGEVSLKVRPKIKHREKLSLRGYGVNGQGDHLFVIDIQYPEDCTKIIELLKEG